MDLSRFEGRKIALLGFGIENISVAKFLLKNGIDFQILDKTPAGKLTREGQLLIKEKKLKIKTGTDYLANISDYNFVIRSPGIPYLTPEIQTAKEAGAEITSSTKLFLELTKCQVIGVTGTKGKGTTASLIYEILKNGYSSLGKIYLAGNIGIASFDIIEEVKSEDLVVLELSSFQIQDLDCSPYVTVVVNLTDDHLDYHQTIEEYQATKQAVLKFQNENDFAVLNKDYRECYKLKEFGKAKKYFFSSKEKTDGAYVNRNGDVILTVSGEEKICSQKEVQLIGRHNLENIAAAAIVGKIFNVAIADIHRVVTEFKGLPHRLEFVREINGVKFYNDSFSTNPTPTMAAIDSFSEPITIILGGSKKGADFTKLADKIKSSTVKNVILIGVEGPRIKKSLEKAGVSANFIDGDKDIETIVHQAVEVAKPNSIILFSPACASFDMFKNYKGRGEKFKQAVKDL